MGVGPVLLPTAESDALGADKWGTGPTVVALKQTPTGWTFGGLANNVWSVAGNAERRDIDSTFLQPFVSKRVGRGRTVSANLQSTYDRDHLLRILRPMWSTETETATRLRGRIECILGWAAHRGYRARKNPAQWEGNLKHELPSPTRIKKRKKQHFPALPYLRVGAFMADLRRREGASIRALEWES
jgi:hypothetical protein